MFDEVRNEDNFISNGKSNIKLSKKSYEAPELIRFGAVSELTASGSDFEKEENTGQDCDNNATRNGMQECTKV
jgi:hypothetical protein